MVHDSEAWRESHRQEWERIWKGLGRRWDGWRKSSWVIVCGQLALIPPHPHLLPNTLGNHRKEIHSQACRGSWDSQAKSWGGCDPAATGGWTSVNTDMCFFQHSPWLLRLPCWGFGGEWEVDSSLTSKHPISCWPGLPCYLEARAAQGHRPRR